MGIRIPQSNVPSSDLDETITKELHDGLGRATTTASSLAAERAVGIVLFRLGLKGYLTYPMNHHSEKLNHKRRRAVISSEEEETSLDHEDSPKHRRMIKEINKDKNVNLVQSSEQGEAQETAKHRMEFSIASPQIDDDETLAETLLNIKRSAAKDKGKANMQESESPKKIKKKEMMHISFDEEISQRLYEEEQVQILRDEEYAQQILFDNTMESIRRFVPIESKGQAGERSSKEGKSLKRSAEEELGQEQKDDLEKLTLMEYVEVIFDSEEVINVIPLAVKSPIVSWKSYCKGDVGYYEIHRADGSYKTYIFFSEMLNDFDREYLIVLYRLSNEKYASTRPGFDDLILWRDMKIMFEPDDDEV
nr:hypothetical protein [Tanacetum cinerariifolium]